MSYPGFNWSPYFDHVADHEGRNQPSDVGGSYQRPSYQSTATPTASNAPSHEYSPAQSSAGRNSDSHSRYTPVGTTNPSSESTRTGRFDSRRLPPYSTAQASINTTAMGNLAYASSLAQEQRTSTTPTRYGSMQHIVDYNRYSQPTSSSAGSAVYGMTSTASNGYEHRSDSRGPGIAREEYKPPDSQSNYLASNTNANANANTSLSNGGYSRSYVRSSSRDDSNTTVSRFASAQQPDSTPITHPKRPASGQSTKLSHPRPTIKSSKPIDHETPQSSTQSGSAVHRVSNQRHQTAKEPRYVEHPTPNHQAATKTHVTQSRPANSEQSIHPLQPNPLPYQQREGQPREGLPQRADQTSHHNTDQSRQTEAQNQTTVDPSQIFNHYEYQRRQATAEAARKAADEVASQVTKPAHFATPAPTPTPAPAPAPAPALVPAPAPAPVAAPAAAGADSAASRKDQMELEMTQMIEKMRDYKAKDPTLFSQIWEQVKKVTFITFLNSIVSLDLTHEFFFF